MMNSTENTNNKKSTYYKESQYNYKKYLLQIAFRYSKSEVKESEIIRKYLIDTGMNAGEFAKTAIREKLEREGLLNKDEG